MIRTAIYCRVSTDKQAEKGDSIPAQLSALHEYIDSHDNMICAGEFVDDGVSGTKFDRDELQKLLAEVKANRIDRIVFTKLDRWYRSIRHYMNTQEILDKHNVTWLALWEPMYDTATPQGRMIINTMLNLAQFEAENTGQRIRQVQAYKVSQGEVISGSTPPGFRIENKHLVPDENAPTVLKAFQYYDRHNNISDTMYAFDHYGIFPKSKAAWKAILRNEKYTGSYRGNPNFCQPIVPRDLFDNVQRKLSKNIKCDQKRTYVFSGLICCAECGTRMQSLHRHINSGRVVNRKMYRCKRHYASKVKTCDNKKSIDETVLERIMLEKLRAEAEKIAREGKERQEPAQDNAKRIASLRHKIDKLKELYLNDLITLDEYKADKEKYESDIVSLESAEPPKTRNLDALRRILDMDLETAYMEMSDDQKRYFWRGLLEKVTMDKDRQIVPYYL